MIQDTDKNKKIIEGLINLTNKHKIVWQRLSPGKYVSEHEAEIDGNNVKLSIHMDCGHGHYWELWMTYTDDKYDSRYVYISSPSYMIDRLLDTLLKTIKSITDEDYDLINHVVDELDNLL